jgi:hypothetical protein
VYLRAPGGYEVFSYLNLPAAVGIGLLSDTPLGRYGYIDNGSLEGAVLSLLSRMG